MNATNAKPVRSLCRSRLEMVEACGRISQVFGFPRSLGQIYGLLYLAPEPLSLDDIAELLGISKGSASTGTRQLSAWGGIRQVWVMGERRDHYSAEPDLGNLLRSGYSEFLKPRLASSQKRFERLADSLDEELNNGTLSREEYKLCSDRLRRFTTLHKKLEALAPLAEKLL
jgi:HTH-type transcriptional regulator, glycine betaine synthesis regulator